MEAFMSMITPYGCNFVIRNWGACWGGLISIAQYNALFSLLGTNFGGDGRTSFGLPDLRGRSPAGYGNGPGLNNMILGQKGGQEYSTITTINLPPHSHTFNVSGATDPASTELPVSTDPAIGSDPDGNYLGTTSGSVRPYSSTLSSPPGTMGPIPLPGQNFAVSGTTYNTGGGQSLYVQSPYQALNYQICMYGIYPSRS
ncbi:phage tail protein [Oceanicaulis sp. MMSF_3324]|uniref:phage tail protein n=1 Tax=Oceanicaulis sp. MMSF_3324 TaxID=3046702 RepID=UPI00273DA16C|nr:tail fiber protein [Oceanicaulis sp. MMSF_3324]